MHLEDLNGLFIHELKDLYSAENQIFDAMPEVIDAVSDERLQEQLRAHFDETRGHIESLEEIFRSLGEDPGGRTCKGMQGLVREASDLLSEHADADVRDAGIIAAIQRIEHYEIAAYGTVATYAKMLGHEHALEAFLSVLEEEKGADADLTELAKSRVNVQALR
jgi:ferritin-like metal-binding protein YciE